MAKKSGQTAKAVELMEEERAGDTTGYRTPPFKPFRWTLSKATHEFGVSAATINSRLRQMGVLPGDDGKFSTRQICSACYGDAQMERTRKLREDADAQELNNQERRKELVNFALAKLYIKEVGITMRQHILSTDIPDEEKDLLAKELADLVREQRITDKICPP